MADPAWFVAKLDQRRALIKERVAQAQLEGVTVVFVFLTEPADDTSAGLAVWEQSCDGCGRWAPTTLSTVMHVEQFKGVQLVVQAGVCPECKEGFSDTGDQ